MKYDMNYVLESISTRMTQIYAISATGLKI